MVFQQLFDVTRTLADHFLIDRKRRLNVTCRFERVSQDAEEARRRDQSNLIAFSAVNRMHDPLSYFLRESGGRMPLGTGPFLCHCVPSLAMAVESASAAVRNQLARFFPSGLIGHLKQLGQRAVARLAFVDPGRGLVGNHDPRGFLVE